MTNEEIEYKRMLYKKLLKHYREKREWCKTARNEYKSSSDIDGLPKGKGFKVNYRMEELIDSISDLEDKLDEILLIVNGLSPTHQDILSKAYIIGITREKLAEERNVDVDRINHLVGYALKEFIEKV